MKVALTLLFSQHIYFLGSDFFHSLAKLPFINKKITHTCVCVWPSKGIQRRWAYYKVVMLLKSNNRNNITKTRLPYQDTDHRPSMSATCIPCNRHMGCPYTSCWECLHRETGNFLRKKKKETFIVNSQRSYRTEQHSPKGFCRVEKTENEKRIRQQDKWINISFFFSKRQLIS